MCLSFDTSPFSFRALLLPLFFINHAVQLPCHGKITLPVHQTVHRQSAVVTQISPILNS